MEDSSSDDDNGAGGIDDDGGTDGGFESLVATTRVQGLAEIKELEVNWLYVVRTTNSFPALSFVRIPPLARPLICSFGSRTEGSRGVVQASLGRGAVMHNGVLRLRSNRRVTRSYYNPAQKPK
jgi:hypothetical protein